MQGALLSCLLGKLKQLFFFVLHSHWLIGFIQIKQSVYFNVLFMDNQKLTKQNI